MRYSRHKRSGISYGCHNESPRTTCSCHKRSCFATSYPLSRIYCRCRIGDLESAWVQMIALFYQLPMDRLWQCKLMLVHTLNHLWQQSPSTSPLPRLSMLMQSFHIPWTFYGNEVMYTLKLYWHCFAIQISMQSIIIIHAMIICEGVQKRSGGPLYDTAVIICEGVWKNHRRSGECVCGEGGIRRCGNISLP